MKLGVCCLLLLSLLGASHGQDDEKQCPAGQMFDSCASPCLPTCDHPVEAEICAEVCVEQCVCKDTTLIMYDDECLTADECAMKDTPARRCQTQAENIRDQGVKLRLQSAISNDSATAVEIKEVLRELKELDGYIGECIKILIDKLTAMACPPNLVFDLVCGSASDDLNSFDDCPMKCDELIRVWENASCFSDRDMEMEKMHVARAMIEDERCFKPGNISNIPLEALARMGEDIGDLIKEDNVDEIADKFARDDYEAVKLLDCDAKEGIASSIFEALQTPEALANGTFNDTFDVLFDMLPYLEEDQCNEIVSLALDYLVKNLHLFAEVNYECKTEESPAIIYEMGPMNRRRKRQVDDGLTDFKDQLAEDLKNKPCDQFNCGKILAKAAFNRVQSSLIADADPCAFAQRRMGGLFSCLDDREKEAFFTCNITTECAATFNSEDKLRNLREKGNCDLSMVDDCRSWCVNSVLQPLIQGDLLCDELTPSGGQMNRTDCLKSKECSIIAGGAICQCPGGDEICKEAKLQAESVRPSDVGGDQSDELIDTIRNKEEKTDQDRSTLNLNALKERKDQPLEELIMDIQGTIQDIKGVKPKDQRDFFDAMVNDSTTAEVAEYIANATNDLKELKGLVRGYLDKLKQEGDLDPSMLSEGVIVLMARSDIESATDPVGLCTLSDETHDARKTETLSGKLEAECMEIAGSTDQEVYLGECLTADLDVACIGFVNSTNLDMVPDDVRGDIMEKLAQDHSRNPFERIRACKAFLMTMGKDWDNDTTSFEEGDEAMKGIKCLLDIDDVLGFLQKVSDKFLVKFLAMHSHPLAWPEAFLEQMDALMDRLATIDMTLFADTSLGEITYFLDTSAGNSDSIIEIVDTLQYDQSEQIDEDREGGKMEQELVKLESESPDTCAAQQTEIQQKLEEKKKEVIDKKNDLEATRRKRSAGIHGRFRRAVEYDCGYVQDLGSAVTSLTVDEINEISDSEFLECVDEFGKYDTYATDSHYSRLMERALTALSLAACDITYSNLGILDNLVYGLTTDELACIAIDDDIMQSWGLMTQWTSAQAETIAVNYLSTGGFTEATLTSAELLLLQNTLCELDIDAIPPVVAYEAVLLVNAIDVDSATTECVTSYATHLKHEDAFGDVSGYDDLTFGDLGIFVGGLTGDEIDMASQEAFDGFSTDAISLIAPAEFANLDDDTFGKFSYDQVMAATADQRDALSSDQELLLLQAAYGDDYTLVLDVTDDDTTGSVATQVIVSMTTMLLALFGKWLM